MILVIFTLLTVFNLSAQEWHPEFYQTLQHGQTPQMMHAIKEVHKLMLTGNEHVVDIGCGDGTITHYIAQNFLSTGLIHGIDISQSMIDKAQQEHIGTNISYSCMSLFDAPKRHYDAAVCFWVLFLFDDYTHALQCVMDTLKPGGKALICHIVAPGTPFFQLFKTTIAPQKIPLNLASLDMIHTAIKQTSATIEYLEVKYNFDQYTNFDAFCAAMKKIPFFQLLSPEKKPGFYKELQTRYTPHADGYVYDYSQVVCMVLKKR